MSNKKLNLFKKRRLRNRNKIKSTDNKRIRMSVHRSSKNIYVQLIDDNIGSTIASASSRMSAIGKNLKNNMETAKLVGKEIAERAKSLKNLAYGKVNKFMHDDIGFNYMKNYQYY